MPSAWPVEKRLDCIPPTGAAAAVSCSRRSTARLRSSEHSGRRCAAKVPWPGTRTARLMPHPRRAGVRQRQQSALLTRQPSEPRAAADTRQGRRAASRREPSGSGSGLPFLPAPLYQPAPGRSREPPVKSQKARSCAPFFPALGTVIVEAHACSALPVPSAPKHGTTRVEGSIVGRCQQRQRARGGRSVAKP